MIILELFGLPGSGKSTITDEAVALLRGQGRAVKTLADFRRERRTGFAGLCAGQPGLLLALLGLIRREGMKLDRDKLRYIKSILMTADYYKRASGADYLIMEQGWIQDVISLCYGHALKDPQALRPLCARLGSLCRPVVTELDLDEAFRRMTLRSKEPGRLDKNADAADRRRIYATMDQNIAALRAALPDCLTLDTRRNPVENAREMVENRGEGNRFRQ